MNWDLIFVAAVILVFASYSAPTYRRFRANRAREQKQPEKYHLT